MIVLEPADDDPQSTTIMQLGEGSPLFLGTGAETWSCSCGMVLARDMPPNAVRGVVLQCGRCHTRSSCPPVPAERPLATRTPGMFPIGSFGTSGPLTIPAGVVLIGEAARDALAGPPAARTGVNAVLSRDLLCDLADQGESLLGARYVKLRGSYRRGRSGADRPHEPERLAGLIELARECAESDLDQITADDLGHLIELAHVVETAQVWAEHPSLGSFTNELHGSRPYVHTVVLFSIAEALSQGNRLELVRATGVGRLPDLRLHFSESEWINVDVKVPTQLVGRTSPLDVAEAERLVEDALSHAGTGPKGQLPPSQPGLLIVGAHWLPVMDMPTLWAGAHAAAPQFPNHILGVYVVNTSPLLRLQKEGMDFGAMTQLIRNPNYAGPFELASPSLPDVRDLKGPGYVVGPLDRCRCGSGRDFERCCR